MNSWKLISVVALASLSACAMPPGSTSGAHPATSKKVHAVHSGYLTGKPRPGSKFSKIRLGMSRQEVQSLIGPPTSENGHITGKQFIPFYYGGDTYRTDWYYRNEGELTFSQSHYGTSSETLIYIRVNPKATGFVK
ncbi:MAG: hypothetical protein ACYDEV_13025 [Acidiferrobacter sp.]